ncbi:hypothetical protein LMG28688_06267 [Paraburkholderia caffeinitolerans]|uniref:Uncharacterized protein n=1 Tax=Paraburkholderia caffeinitolerans TaxID=1723730 RepID=A0A6J5GS72_9BURK|nr:MULTISPECIES: hypothetical protein [Paraburkholderia]CAB3805980.1 hypothetical protein LMG28688_06267 [Paraburkholderia caffeinitolerans]
MARSKPGLIGTLFAVGALGATAGMLALRWAQRHRMQRQSFYRDLSRWEGEGGALMENGAGVPEVAASDSGANVADPIKAARTVSKTARESANGMPGGEPGSAWPFPHGSGDPVTRH